MTQEEKDKKEEQVVRQPAQPAVLPQYAEQTAEAVEKKRRQEEGGIYAQLQQRLQTATQNRDRAARRWRDSYEKTGDVMRSFVPKPKDTGDEQRRLKRIALGQAIGQLVGALGAGVVGATTEGWTPAASPAGLYNPAAARLQQLREQEDRDIRDYNNLMAKIQQSLAAGDQAVAQQELKRATDDVADLERLLAQIEIARERNEALASRQDANNEFKAGENQANRENQRVIAGIRASKNGDVGGMTDNATRILGYLLPEEKKVTRTAGDKTTTTSQPYQSYNKQLVNAISVVAKKLDSYNVAPHDAGRLNAAIAKSANSSANWDNVMLALSNGYSVDEIIARL